MVLNSIKSLIENELRWVKKVLINDKFSSFKKL